MINRHKLQKAKSKSLGPANALLETPDKKSSFGHFEFACKSRTVMGACLSIFLIGDDSLAAHLERPKNNLKAQRGCFLNKPFEQVLLSPNRDAFSGFDIPPGRIQDDLESLMVKCEKMVRNRI